MKRKREVFLSVVLLAGILVFASACSASKKEQEAASQSGTEQASDKETADKQTTEEQASGTAAAGEQTNSTQVSDVKPVCCHFMHGFPRRIRLHRRLHRQFFQDLLPKREFLVS